MLPEGYNRRTACPFSFPELSAVRTMLAVFSRESGRYLAGSFVLIFPDPTFRLPVPSTEAKTNGPIRQRVDTSPLLSLSVSLVISDGSNVRESSDTKSILSVHSISGKI